MAIAYLNENATSLASANWSDTTGFANGATLVINRNTAPITGGMDQSATSIESLDILDGCTAIIGGGSAGSLTCDVDGTSEAETGLAPVSRLRYFAGGGALYFNAGGGNTLAHFVQIATGGTFYATGGILKNVHLERGAANFGPTVLATSGAWRFTGGTSVVSYNASGAIPELVATGGIHTLLRNATTLTVAGGAQITIDAQGLAFTTINVFGGSLRLINSGTITTLNALGGTLDLSSVGRPITITTARIAGEGALLVKKSSLVTVTNRVAVGRGQGLA